MLEYLESVFNKVFVSKQQDIFFVLFNEKAQNGFAILRIHYDQKRKFCRVLS